MSEEIVSLAEQFAYAEGKVGDAQSPRVTSNDISALQLYCKQFIANANMSDHTRMMASIKVDEMIFWIRAGTG